MTNKLITVPFTKVDDDARMIYGYASTAHRDSDGEIITLDALRSALPGYMKFAAVREMHNAKAIGKTKEASVDDNGLYIGAKIVDDQAWKLIKNEVYSAFSVGGRITERDETDPSIIKSMSLIEISLVDVPANINCTIDLYKVADVTIEKRDDNGDCDCSDPDDASDPDCNCEDEEEDDEDKSAAVEVTKSDEPEHEFDQTEDAVLYKRMLERFGQEKADAVFKHKVKAKVAEPVVVTPEPVVEVVKVETTDEPVTIDYLASHLISDLFKDFDIDKISALQSTAKKEDVRNLLEFIKSTKDICAKAGARHSRSDTESLQTIHDHSSKMGAKCCDKESGVKAGDLSKAYEKTAKITKMLNEANEVINKLNKQVADKEDYIEKLKKSPRVPMPITTSAELPEGLVAVGKGETKKVTDINISREDEIKKAMREARNNFTHV